MVSVQRFKRLAAVVVLLIGAALSLAIIRQAGSAIVRSATGADPTSIFTDIPPAPADVRLPQEQVANDPHTGQHNHDNQPRDPRSRLAVRTQNRPHHDSKMHQEDQARPQENHYLLIGHAVRWPRLFFTREFHR